MKRCLSSLILKKNFLITYMSLPPNYLPPTLLSHALTKLTHSNKYKLNHI